MALELIFVSARTNKRHHHDNLRLVCGLKVKAVEALLPKPTGSLPLSEVIAALGKWGDGLLAWIIWRTVASSSCSGTKTLLV